jgi:serine/threonine-protein kinase HipA
VTSLDVWLAGRRVATLAASRAGLSMTYTDEAGPIGAPLVSMSMPVVSRPYGNKQARPFFNGLLPEGEARSIIAYGLGIDSSDDFSLLRELGKDCAGALSIQSAGDPVPTARSSLPAAPLSAADVERLLKALPVHPLGFDGAMIRVSLAGMQPKLLLAQTIRKEWALPTYGVISTHILKPPSRFLPATVANEALCMIAANRAGLSSAATRVETFGPVTVVVSTRFDRRVGTGALVERVHQEDACQALSILTSSPDLKYERHSPVLSLLAISRRLGQWADPSALDELLTHLTFNVVIGNADYHGKNISFLHDPDAAVRVAPLYDAMSTVYYSGLDDLPPVDTDLGLRISTKSDINEVTVDDLVDEAARWGVRRSRAIALVADLVERLPAAFDQAANEVPTAPGRLIELIRSRVESAASDLTRITRA